MAKTVNPTVLDQALAYIQSNANQQNACSAQPTTPYAAMDANAWAASTAYSLNTAVRPTTRNGFTYQATAVTGATGATEPTWPTTAGATVVDGGVTWTAVACLALAAQAMVTGDYSIANGVTGGTTPRKLTLAAKTGAAIFATGTASFVALVKLGSPTVVPELELVTTCTAQALTSGNTLNFPSWGDEIGAPT